MRRKGSILVDFKRELVNVSKSFGLCHKFSTLYVDAIGVLTLTPISIPVGAP